MPWVLPSVFGCTLIWFDNIYIYIYLFHVVCVCIYGEISAIVLSLTKRRRSLQLLRWSSVKGFSVLIVPTLPTRRVSHFTGVNWMRLSVFCESGFCLIRCWMGVLFHLLPWFPSALYRTSSMPALLSLLAWLSWRPGVTHCRLRPGCSRTHVALLCLTCTLVYIVSLRLILPSLPRSEWKRWWMYANPQVENTATGLTSVWWWWHVQFRLWC